MNACIEVAKKDVNNVLSPCLSKDVCHDLLSYCSFGVVKFRCVIPQRYNNFVTNEKEMNDKNVLEWCTSPTNIDLDDQGRMTISIQQCTIFKYDFYIFNIGQWTHFLSTSFYPREIVWTHSRGVYEGAKLRVEFVYTMEGGVQWTSTLYDNSM